ncbi:MAG: TniQ family protein [Sulfitobacter sp.]
MSRKFPTVSKLPIALAAMPGEPGFSVLSRNAAVNASLSSATFCTATGLSKAGICAGDAKQLGGLARLTGSDLPDLLRSSPSKVSGKFTLLNKQQFLTRSIRKQDLSICPVCWIEDLEKGAQQVDGCVQRWQWLPRFASCCAQHDVALCELPYSDYTTCYDHLLRIAPEPGWIRSLETRIIPRTPSAFETAALKQVEDQTPIIKWLSEVQIDVLERWCLGLGAFIASGTLRPDTAPQQQQRELIDLGLSVSRGGHGKIFDEIDKALGRHSIRLSNTWLHGWALQSSSPEERSTFRKLMQELSQDQGDYYLVSRQRQSSDQAMIDAWIKKISHATGRQAKWVRSALTADGFLPYDANVKRAPVKPFVRSCQTHIRSLAASKSLEQSAEHLGAGIVMFKGLIVGGTVSPIKTRAFKKPRFSPAELDRVLDVITQATARSGANRPPDKISIGQAAFIYRCPASQILQFLEAGDLPSSYVEAPELRMDALHISRQELSSAMHRHARQDILLGEAKRRLGLSSPEMRIIITNKLLPTHFKRTTPNGKAHEFIKHSDLVEFLKTYHTPKTAQIKLGVSPSKLAHKIKAAKLAPAPAGGGARVYDRVDILNL